jgi:threonine synthase
MDDQKDIGKEEILTDPMLDGAAPQPDPWAGAPPEVVRAASDPERNLEERLEAFEDIADSEVGDTTFSRARNLERELGVRQIYLKFEGGNPSGTQKDRIAFAQAMDALRRGFEGITLATCGNYGAAMALAARLAGLDCRVHIPERYRTRRIAEMERLGARILRVPGDYETAVETSRELAAREDLYDANPGGENTSIQLRAYGEIAWEIYDELRDAPAAVALPVSNGTTLAGVYRGFLSLHRRGRTSRMPRFVAGSAFRKNPIVNAFLKGLPACEDLAPDRIRETRTNEPLINWHSVDGDLALDAVRSTDGWAVDASDKSMKSFARLLADREGLNVLPASTAGLIALRDRNLRDALPADRYVIVMTGKK